MQQLLKASSFMRGLFGQRSGHQQLVHTFTCAHCMSYGLDILDLASSTQNKQGNAKCLRMHTSPCHLHCRLPKLLASPAGASARIVAGAAPLQHHPKTICASLRLCSSEISRMCAFKRSRRQMKDAFKISSITIDGNGVLRQCLEMYNP